MATNTKRSLIDTIANINKIHGIGSVLSGNEVISIERMKTGSLTLDIITGGGYGLGRIVEVYGPESSGKTTLCIHTAIEAQRAFPNKKVAIIDAEHALDRDYCEHLGLDMSKVIISQPDNGEQALDILQALIESGEISMAFVDSIAALTPKSEIDGEMGDASMGGQARLISKAMRKLVGVISQTKTVVVFTNQLRSKIGIIFGNPETTPGGNAMKFYASMRIDIRKSAGDKDGDEVINSKVTCKTVKNKLAPPFRKCHFDIVFGKGIDKASEILAISEEIGLIEKAGSWFSYKGSKLGQGAPAVKTMLRDNPELMNELEALIYKQMDTSA